MPSFARRYVVFGLAAAALVVSQAVWGPSALADVPAIPIPQNPSDVAAVPSFVGSPATPKALTSFPVPRHPFMAPNGLSNIHDDAYMTDAYAWAGPLGRSPQVTSTYQNAECASVTFDGAGRLVTICVGVEGPRLVMLDPATLATKAVFPLPPRSGGGGGVFSDFSGGGYFYLDQLDQAVIPTNSHQIWVVGETSTATGPGFELVRAYDLSTVVAPNEGIISALPDWSGRLWFATTQGLVGTVDPASGQVQTVRLTGEAIGNSFAVDETGGVFVVSDHAMYRFDPDQATGAPVVTWREAYDRGTRQKPGQVNFGSGTTPTLVGSSYVAITDNADPRMHVLVYKRSATVSGSRLVCSQPVFGAGTGATENSLIAVGSSLIVENNYGYTGPTSTTQGASTEPGISRVDFTSKGCRTAWTSQERVPSTVSKASLATGLIYTYTKDVRADGIDAWYFTAVDVRTGRTVWKRLAGTGLGYNNNFGPVSIGADATAYVGVLGGLVEIRDPAP